MLTKTEWYLLMVRAVEDGDTEVYFKIKGGGWKTFLHKTPPQKEEK